jgi:CheY-like chemotaxis protein
VLSDLRPSPGATILIVEDEPILRMMAVDLVENAGFQALEAANADEAMRILESRDDVRLIFTDVDMPGSMDGLRLAAYVRGRWPPIDIIITSGHCEVQAGQVPERGRFFRKPYAPAEIIDVIREMLG